MDIVDALFFLVYLLLTLGFTCGFLFIRMRYPNEPLLGQLPPIYVAAMVWLWPIALGLNWIGKYNINQAVSFAASVLLPALVFLMARHYLKTDSIAIVGANLRAYFYQKWLVAVQICSAFAAAFVAVRGLMSI